MFLLPPGPDFYPSDRTLSVPESGTSGLIGVPISVIMISLTNVTLQFFGHGKMSMAVRSMSMAVHAQACMSVTPMPRECTVSVQVHRIT